MNKILTNSGGQPFFLDDINFLESAICESFKGLLSGITKNSGMYLTDLRFIRANDETISWVDGYIVLGEEVLPVKRGVLNAKSDTPLYWDIKSLKEGSRIFEDGQEHNCYEIREAILTTAVTDFPENKIKSITEAIYELMTYKFEMPLISQDINRTYSDGYGCAGKITYRQKIKNNMINDYDFKLQITAFSREANSGATINTIINSERILCEIPILNEMFGSQNCYAGTAVFQNSETNALTTYTALAFTYNDKAYVALRNMAGIPLTKFGFGMITISIDLNRG